MRSGPGADAPAAPEATPETAQSGAAPADGAEGAPVPADPDRAPLFAMPDSEADEPAPAAAPPAGDGAAAAAESLLDDGEPIDHEAARRESRDIREGYALRLAADLARVLDAVLPLARGHMAVPAAQGGPAEDRFVADPHGGPSARILPEILEAEILLHRASSLLGLEPAEPDLGQAVDTLAGSSGLEDLPDEAFVDADEAPAEPPPSGDPVLDAARRLVRADEAVRARAIAGLPPGAELLARRDAARDALAGAPPPEAAPAAPTPT